MRLKKWYKEYQALTKHYHPSLIVAGIEYNLILVIVPIWYLLEVVLKYIGLDSIINLNEQWHETIGLPDVGIATLLLIINVVIITARFIKSLTKASDIVFNDELRKNISLNVRNYCLAFLLIMGIIGLSVVTAIIISISRYFKLKWFTEILRIVLPFMLFWIIISVIFKYVIPIKVRYRDAFKICFIINAYYYLAIFVYRFLLTIPIWKKYQLLYGNVAFIIIFLYFLYILIYLFLFALIWYYKKNKKKHILKKVENNIYEHEMR